ncbi:hypothetical protein NDU88_000438 [Pleurodeles waltl]|uniref:Remorin C-terminal domain-containing protein n=1 Tax=Pleurodeles waltl TaxID=8319 RepID=A0AAV7WFH6_PLEWA|nr:hypothetical protein NDU88_000438 [Pleurodeles waltl]
MSPIASKDREAIEQDKEPSHKQTSPGEVPEQALQSGVKWCSPEVAQESPTPPEDNSGGRAMQSRQDMFDCVRVWEKEVRGRVKREQALLEKEQRKNVYVKALEMRKKEINDL